ncbi:hypothetical protein DWB77_00246 [Streptomyces hundungensis]|uniref:Uncharacterized protein n=1 Tax=Streptomyces hundungensis TaxID=1077946 RepID=A0A387H4L4_9ACTN|nr:hypothetical protein [Streptomyces hundungensis]AYG78139.1 hypothetical protein DWB77_00246 [Streptomyces hundungensis]
MNPLLLRLYPAGFRRAFGDEIAESYREATAGAGPCARFREAADIAAHALRLRLGINSAHAGGGLMATAAPFALAATAAYAAFNLIGDVGDWYVMWTVGAAGEAGPLLTLMKAGYLLTLLGAVVALAGRYVPGVLAAVTGTVTSSVSFLSPIWPTPADVRWEFAGFLLVPVLFAALPLACPPDLRPSPRARRTAGVFALAVWAVLLVAAIVVIDPLGIGLFVPWRFGVPIVAALALAGRQAFTAVRTVGQLVLAATPFMGIMWFSGWVHPDELLSIVGALAITAVVLRLRRRDDTDRINTA